MKKLELNFYQTDPGPKNLGMKIVLLEITTLDGPIYDYGMADWLGTSWDVIPQLEGHLHRVLCWANWPDPKNLIEEKRIISG